MDIIKKKFGERLKVIRNIKGYTQETLSEKVGINQRQLVKIESGISFVKSETLEKLCCVLEINPSFLFDFDLDSDIDKLEVDNQIQFNIEKIDNVVKLITTKERISAPIHDSLIKKKSQNKIKSSDFDKKMQAIAHRIKKTLVVNEKQDDLIIRTKIYPPTGSIITKEIPLNEENSFDRLNENLSKISKDAKKLEYINLAIESLYSQKALETLKTLIKGVELGLSEKNIL